jgi:NitT/TauT family transport system substrate-binding protein
MSKLPLRIGHLSTAYHTNFILMNDTTLPKNLNRNIIWKLYSTGPSIVQAFQEGNLDLGYMGLPPAIIGISKGVPIKCVAGGHVEGTVMIAKSNYKTIVDLNGEFYELFKQFNNKFIGVPSKGSIHDVMLNSMLDNYGKDFKISIKNYEQAEFIALDLKKNILAAGVGTPSLAVFSSTILKLKIIIPPNFFWVNNPSYGIFFHEKIIESNPEIVLEFLRYHKKASYMLRDSPSKAADIISKTFNILSKEYVESVLQIAPKYCIALSEGYINSAMKFVEILYKLGYITHLIRVNDIFTFKFIQEVHPESPHY